jgi:hypothetical protein
MLRAVARNNDRIVRFEHPKMLAPGPSNRRALKLRDLFIFDVERSLQTIHGFPVTQ